MSERLALITVGIMAVWPWIVAYNRMGFTYNQLSFFLAVTIYACWKYTTGKKKVWALIACFAGGLSISTDYLGAIAPLTVLGLMLLYNRRWLLSAVLIPCAVLVIVLFPTYQANPPFFFSDLGFVVQSRGSISFVNQLINLLVNYGELIRHEAWIIIGLIGLFLLPPGRGRGLVWFVVVVSLLVILRTIAPVGICLHYLVHLFPWFVLGIAAFFERSFSWLTIHVFDALDQIKKFFPSSMKPFTERKIWTRLIRVSTTLIILILLINPIIWMTIGSMAQSAYGVYFIFSGDEDLYLSQEKDVEQVNAFLHKEASPYDLIIAPTQILWSTPGRKGELSTTLLFDGENVDGMQRIDNERFAYSQTLKSAKFVILDPLTRKLSVLLNKGLDDVVANVEKWPMVYKSGDIEVYQNPLQATSTTEAR